MNNKELFESIYRESKNQETYERISYLFTRWNDLRKEASKAYKYADTFTNTEMYADAEKIHGSREASNMKNQAWHNYSYAKAERDRIKKEFDELLASCPDFNTEDANRLCNVELMHYLQDLNRKGQRKDTAGIEQDDSLPHINQNIKVDVKSYKVSPIKDFNGRAGAFINVTGKDGILYSFWLFKDSNSKIFKDGLDIDYISGIVNKINDFYGKLSIMLKQVDIKYVDINIYDEKEFQDFYDSLNPEPVKVNSSDELPKNAKLYKTCIKEYTHGYIYGSVIKKIYKADDLYYFLDESWRDSMD